jgi:hypothetical protein
MNDTLHVIIEIPVINYMIYVGLALLILFACGNHKR